MGKKPFLVIVLLFLVLLISTSCVEKEEGAPEFYPKSGTVNLRFFPHTTRDETPNIYDSAVNVKLTTDSYMMLIAEGKSPNVKIPYSNITIKNKGKADTNSDGKNDAMEARISFTYSGLKAGEKYTLYHDYLTFQYLDASGKVIHTEKGYDGQRVYLYIEDDIKYTAQGYSGKYDGKAHGPNISVTYPNDAVIKYGTSANSINMSTAPTYTKEGEYTVWYQISAYSFSTVTGKVTISISNTSTHVHSSSLTLVKEVPATCTSNGCKAYYKCSCGKYFKDSSATSVISDLTSWKSGEGKLTASHTIVIDKAVSPTCLKTGLTEGKHCSVCKTVIVSQQTLPKGNHTEVIDKAVSPTCLKTGLTEGKHCSVCKTVIVAQQTLPKGNHTEVIDKAVSPTCLKTGLTEGKHCSVCKKVIVAQQTLPKGDHTEVIDKAVSPTCKKTGLTEGKHCSVCKKVIVAQKKLSKIDHIEVVVEAVPPTCIDKGLTEGKSCSMCSKVFVAQEEIPPTGTHTEIIIEGKEPTCTSSGKTEEKRCSVCQAVLLAGEILPIKGHSWSEDWKTNEDSHWNECSCGEKTNIELHKDENKDKKCDVCQAEVELHKIDKIKNVIFIAVIVLVCIGIVAIIIMIKNRLSY